MPEGSNRRLTRYCCYALLAAIILLFAFVRFRLREFPLERDEGEYAYAGQLILQGIPPYQLAYNMKLPGTYAAYSLILAAFGQTTSAIHMGVLLINAATTVLVFFLAARLFGQLAGLVAGASYALLSTSPSVLGIAGHATHFVVLPAIAGILLLLKAIENRRVWLFFWSGVLLGLAFLMKQHGSFFVLFAGVWLAQTEGQQRPLNWRGITSRVGAFLCGTIFPIAVTGLILFLAGAFAKFWFWTFVYAHEYVSIRSASNVHNTITIVKLLGRASAEAMGPAVWIWIIAAVGLTAFRWSRHSSAHVSFVAEFFVFSLLAICPGFYFRPHYFILLLPSIAVLAGLAVTSATEKLAASGKARTLVIVPALVFILAFGFSIVRQRQFLFQLDPDAACRELYAENPFPEAVRMAGYIRTHAPSAAAVAVLGSEPEIYFYSGRHSATGYIYTYGLVEELKYAFRMQKEMIAEIEAARPEFLVYVDVPVSLSGNPGAPQYSAFIAWAEKYMQDYEQVGIADIGNLRTEYRWDEDAKGYKSRSPFTVRLLKRKT